MSAAVCRPALWGGRPSGRFSALAVDARRGPVGRYFVLREQRGGTDLEGFAQRVEGRHVHAIHHPALVHEAVGVRHRDREVGQLRQLVGAADLPRLHQLGDAKPHIEHATNLTTDYGSSKSLYTLAVITGSGYNVRRTYGSRI